MYSFKELYDAWHARTSPSKTTARMTRRTLRYVASALRIEQWETLAVMPAIDALALLDAAMSTADLVPQSRSNYRGYLRRLYRFAEDEGLYIDGADGRDMWPSVAPYIGIEKRSQVAYERFVKWAVVEGIWPSTVTIEAPLNWALSERPENAHWRQDYRRLQSAWKVLSDEGVLGELQFAPLPTPINQRFALPAGQWPKNLQHEWEQMRKEATSPLRKGGMRPWRTVTIRHYEHSLQKYVGWFQTVHGEDALDGECWSSLLTADRCRQYINWLIQRTSKDHLNPSHTAFLRTIRGFHRFLLGSDQSVIDDFDDLARRCEVQERDKAARIVPYPILREALDQLLSRLADGRQSRAIKQNRRASLQVDALILGLLVTRALRSKNLRQLTLGDNLREENGAHVLHFTAAEMKGHRPFATSLPAELAPVLECYLKSGFKALTGHPPKSGDVLLVNNKGRQFDGQSFATRVIRISKHYVGERLNAHLYRHILATHAAQVLKMTPPELAALLAHRSAATCMKYYEVTNPSLAAGRLDELNANDAEDQEG